MRVLSTWHKRDRASCMFHRILGCAPAAFEEAQTCRCLFHLRFDKANSSAKKASWQWNNLNIFKRNKDIGCKGCISRTFGASWVPPLFLAFWNWNTWKLPWKFWECPALNHRSSVSKLRTHKHHRKSKLKFGKSFNCKTYDNHPGLGSQGNHYKPVFLPWLLKIQPSHFQWSQTRPPNQRFPPEVANPKELKAAEPRSPSTATVLRPRSFRAWASMFLQLSKTDMDGHGWHHETDDQIIIWGKPMENPEFFLK